MPLFTLIARVPDKLMLVESLDIQDDKTPELERYRKQAKELISSIQPSDTTGIVNTPPYYFMYLIENDVIYLTCCDASYPKNFAYSFLSELKKEFDLSHGTEIQSIKRPYAFEAFDTFIQKTKKLYMDTKSQRNLNKVNTELKDIEKIMTKSIHEILGRGAKIDEVMAKSSALSSQAQRYRKTATNLNTMYWWRTYGPLIAAVVFFFLLIVAICACMPLSKKIRVSTGGIHGRCWFAAEDIKEGELLWWAPEQLHPLEVHVSIEEVQSWPEEKRNKFMELAYQINETTLAGFPDDLSELPPEYVAENFVNHSCDGNAWYEGDDKLVAKRDIKAGEEITYDYALTEAHPLFRLECMCGQANCRKIVTGDDWKLPELQERYGNHFLAHILEKIRASKNQ